MKINIADYISIKQYKEYQHYLGFEDIELLKQSILLFTDITEDELNKWSDVSIINVSNTIFSHIDKNTSNIFYNVIRINSRLYAFTSITNMTLAEYIDLETLCQNTQDNLEEIMAILYRPAVIKGEYTTEKYYNIDLIKGDIEVDIEPYNNKNRKTNSKVFADIPLLYAQQAVIMYTTQRKQLIEKYSALFEGGEKDEESNQPQWGWFSMLYSLAHTPILSLTGDKSITDLNVAFVFNWLAYEHHIEQQRKLQQIKSQK